MAVQGTIETQGGLNATNAYLRINSIVMKKIIGGSDNNRWQLVYNVDAYVNASARNSAPDTRLAATHVSSFKIISDTEPGDCMAIAYGNLKAQNAVSNVSDLV